MSCVSVTTLMLYCEYIGCKILVAIFQWLHEETLFVNGRKCNHPSANPTKVSVMNEIKKVGQILLFLSSVISPFLQMKSPFLGFCCLVLKSNNITYQNVSTKYKHYQQIIIL